MLVELLHSCCVFSDSTIVGLLGTSESASVDTVVDIGVDPLIDVSHLLLQGLRFKIQLWILGEVIELTVKESNDL